MNAPFANPAADAQTTIFAASPDAARDAVPIRVWDLPVRVFHWGLVACFAGAWLTAESERWRDVHVMLGYTLIGLVAFRLLWGFAGTRYARFRSFLFSPAAVWRYLRSIRSGTPQHFTGHNPVGSLAVFVLLGLSVLASLSGVFVYQDIGGEWLEEVHELAAGTMLALAGLHVIGVLASSALHRENLARSMLSGWKSGDPADGIRGMYPVVSVMLLAAMGLFWWAW